ncbi:MAG: GFA family protein [Kordiimonadaceae bacterium]|nr:GFA family protein [Kordiimonadaceae bacterium]
MSTPVGPISGGCQCGEIKYVVEGTIFGLSVCHCHDCQRQSGSAFGLSLIVASDSFELIQGTLKTFETTTDSGRTKTCAFCPECGNRICNRTESRVSIKAGTLDDVSWLKPRAHLWVSRKQPWVDIPDGVTCYEFDSDG